MLLERGGQARAGKRFVCQRNSAHWPGARDFSCGFPASARRLSGAGRAFNSNQVPLKGKHSKKANLVTFPQKKKKKEGNHTHFSELSSLVCCSVLPTTRSTATLPHGNQNHQWGWKEKSRAQHPARSPEAQAGQNPSQTAFVALACSLHELSISSPMSYGGDQRDCCGPVVVPTAEPGWTTPTPRCPASPQPSPLQTSCSPKSDICQAVL